MRTVVLGERTPELEALIARRRALGPPRRGLGRGVPHGAGTASVAQLPRGADRFAAATTRPADRSQGVRRVQSLRWRALPRPPRRPRPAACRRRLGTDGRDGRRDRLARRRVVAEVRPPCRPRRGRGIDRRPRKGHPASVRAHRWELRVGRRSVACSASPSSSCTMPSTGRAPGDRRGPARTGHPALAANLSRFVMAWPVPCRPAT